jgi:endoglucanase
MINAIRSAGAATQPILVAGINFATDMSQWRQFIPADPNHGLVASLHSYVTHTCGDQACLGAAFTDLHNGGYPVIMGEIGEYDCQSAPVVSNMTFAEQNFVGYMAWVWRVADCGATPSLIQDYNGTPSSFGAGVKAHYIAINP